MYQRREMGYLTFAASSEEPPHDEDLETSHGNHHAAFHQAEIEDSLRGAVDRAEIAILPSTEVLLLPRQSRDLTRQLQDSLLHTAELFRGGASLLRESGLHLVLDLNYMISEL